jgi:hypothetical protein
LHPHQRRDHVELEDGTQVNRVQLLERDMKALSGVVHQHIDRAVGVDGPGDQPPDIAGNGDVGGDGERARQLGGERLKTLGPPSGEHDSCAQPAQQARRRGADPGRRPGNNADRPIDTHRVLRIPVRPSVARPNMC